MRVSHYGHSCVLVDTGAARLLFDPGSFSSGFEGLTGLDAVLVTHQHADHLDTERLGALLTANPDARLYVDAGSADLVGSAGTAEVLAPGTSVDVAGARVDVLGGDHAVIHPDVPIVPNNAYLVDGTLLHPGDSFTPPPAGAATLDILLLPTGAPWLKLADAVDYLRAVRPRTAVPVHEAVLSRPAMHYGMFESLGPGGTTVRVLDREVPTDL